MGKHSKQAATREFFTSNEREKARAAAGTERARLGADSQRKFDQCGICLSRLIQPVAAPTGYLFCKECIIRNLLQQKGVIAEQRASFEAQQLDLAREDEAKSTAAVLDSAAAFAKLEGGVGVTSAAGGAGRSTFGSSESRSVAGEDRALRAAASALHDRESGAHRVDLRDKADKTADAKRTSFWAAAAVPTAAAAKLSAPDPHTRCPCSGAPLRAKQLVELHLSPASAAAAAASSASSAAAASGAAGGRSSSGFSAGADGEGAEGDDIAASSSASAGAGAGAGAGADVGFGSGGRSFAAAVAAEVAATAAEAEAIDGLASGTCRFVCPACLKGLSSQKVYAFAGCGHALCEGCTRQFVLPTKRCFECNMQIKGKGEILALQQAGTSFAGHAGTVAEAAKWRPSLIA